MKYFPDTFPTVPLEFLEPVPRHAFNTTLGWVVVSFAFLEDAVCNVLALLLKMNVPPTPIPTDTASFEERLVLLANLARREFAAGRYSPTDSADDFEEWLQEVMLVARRAEHLRNKYVHSSYYGHYWEKKSSPVLRRPQLTKEEVSAGRLMDVANYIENVGLEVQGLPFWLGMADYMQLNGDKGTYQRNGREVFKVRFTHAMSLATADGDGSK